MTKPKVKHVDCERAEHRIQKVKELARIHQLYNEWRLYNGQAEELVMALTSLDRTVREVKARLDTSKFCAEGSLQALARAVAVVPEFTNHNMLSKAKLPVGGDVEPPLGFDTVEEFLNKCRDLVSGFGEDDE